MNSVETVIIYRVEDADGRGPFNSHLNEKISSNFNYENLDMYPTPLEDWGISRIAEEFERTGCKNLTQLYYWFDNDQLKYLKENNYTVYKLEVEKSSVIFGGHQVLFNKNKIYKKSVILWNELNNIHIQATFGVA